MRVLAFGVVAVTAVGLAACGSGERERAGAEPAPAVETAVQQPVRVEDGRLVNDDALYSVALPEGWAPREDSRPELVILDRAGSDAALAILIKPANADAATEVAALRDMLVASPAGYEVLDEAARTLAGRSAAVLLTRVDLEGQSRVTRHVVTVERGLAFVFGVEMAEGDREQLEPEVEQLLESVRLD